MPSNIPITVTSISTGGEHSVKFNALELVQIGIKKGKLNFDKKKEETCTQKEV